MSIAAYDPNDTTQTTFLGALASGESGAYSNPATVGFGGVNLAGAPTSANGFPVWAGAVTTSGPTHAAGIYQFQPATWNSLASELGLNFGSVSDQNAAAWTLAAQNYATANNGANLETALQNGDFTGVASSLHSTWTSLTGTELAGAFGGSGTGSQTASTTAPASSPPAPSASASLLSPSTWFPALDASLKNMFVRGGVFILALLLIGFGLYYLSDQASDGDDLSAAVKAAAVKAAIA